VTSADISECIIASEQLPGQTRTNSDGHSGVNCSPQFCSSGTLSNLWESKLWTQIFQRNLLSTFHFSWAHAFKCNCELMKMIAMAMAMAMEMVLVMVMIVLEELRPSGWLRQY
jgi:hypothetical protein